MHGRCRSVAYSPAKKDALRADRDASGLHRKEPSKRGFDRSTDGTSHDFLLLNALRNHPSTRAAILQACDAIKRQFEA